MKKTRVVICFISWSLAFLLLGGMEDPDKSSSPLGMIAFLFFSLLFGILYILPDVVSWLRERDGKSVRKNPYPFYRDKTAVHNWGSLGENPFRT